MPAVVVGDTGTAGGLTTIKVGQVPIDTSADSQDEVVGDTVTDPKTEALEVQTSVHHVVVIEVRINRRDADLAVVAIGRDISGFLVVANLQPNHPRHLILI